MNTYSLVPAAEYHPKVPRRDFDGITESIMSNPQLDEYQRAVALQESLNKFLNISRTREEPNKQDVDMNKVKAVVDEGLGAFFFGVVSCCCIISSTTASGTIFQNWELIFLNLDER